jgi:hypothetical protein
MVLGAVFLSFLASIIAAHPGDPIENETLNSIHDYFLPQPVIDYFLECKAYSKDQEVVFTTIKKKYEELEKLMDSLVSNVNNNLFSYHLENIQQHGCRNYMSHVARVKRQFSLIYPLLNYLKLAPDAFIACFHEWNRLLRIDQELKFPERFWSSQFPWN